MPGGSAVEETHQGDKQCRQGEAENGTEGRELGRRGVKLGQDGKE